MSNYFQLPEGVRVAGNLPIDADRYIATNISERDLIVTNNRGFNGLQVYVESVKTLFLLEDVSVPTWVTISTSGSSSTYIESSSTEIIFNSGGTLSGHSNLIYDYNTSTFKFSGDKSVFSIRSSSLYNPSIYLSSNYYDGFDINIASNYTNIGGILKSTKSFGSQTAKTNISSTNLFTYKHNGYYNDVRTGIQIKANAIEWSNNSYTSEYKIETISSGNTSLEERFKINSDGAIKFNNSYIFPQISGTSGQVLTLSANSYLYWETMINNTLSGLTDTIINSPQDGDKLVYSGGSWMNVNDADYVYSENLGSGGTYEFVVGNVNDNNAFFIHFMNYRKSGTTEKVFQMGELQLLHDGTDSQVTTNGQDLDLFVSYKSKLSGNDVILICYVPTNLSTDVTMKYTIEKF